MEIGGWLRRGRWMGRGAKSGAGEVKFGAVGWPNMDLGG
jgi:hypothetical protein